MRASRIAVLGLMIPTLSAGAADPPAYLIGTWEVVRALQGGSPPGSTLTFKRNGEFESKIKGTQNTFTGKFRVQGDSLMLDPPGFPATVQVVDPNTIVISSITGPAEYRRQGAGAGDRAAMPRSGRRPASANSRRPPGVAARAATGGVTSGPGTSDGGTVSQAAGGWKLVASEPYGFRVEMPHQPDGEERGSGDGFSMHVLTSQLPGMELLVMAVKAPTEIPKAEEEKVYERLRNQAAGKLGGGATVASQLAVRAGQLAGIEYEMTIEKPSVGSLPARGRVFLGGKSAYVVMAASRAKGKALPADAKRFLESFGPRPAELEGARGGMAKGDEVDPDGDVAITRAGDRLQMTLPATAHVLAPDKGKLNAPRVLSPIQGPFVATVLVDGDFEPAQGSTFKGLSSRQAGGLILWKDAGNFLSVQRRAVAGEDDQIVLQEFSAGRNGASLRQPVEEGPVFLRIESKGRRIVAAYSGDGKDWKELRPIDAAWAGGKLQVGVVAVSTSPRPCEVYFDDVRVTAE